MDISGILQLVDAFRFSLRHLGDDEAQAKHMLNRTSETLGRKAGISVDDMRIVTKDLANLQQWLFDCNHMEYAASCIGICASCVEWLKRHEPKHKEQIEQTIVRTLRDNDCDIIEVGEVRWIKDSPRPFGDGIEEHWECPVIHDDGLRIAELLNIPGIEVFAITNEHCEKHNKWWIMGKWIHE